MTFLTSVFNCFNAVLNYLKTSEAFVCLMAAVCILAVAGIVLRLLHIKE